MMGSSQSLQRAIPAPIILRLIERHALNENNNLIKHYKFME